jgi:cobalt/nickel transport system ATP-binding protein
MFALSRVGFDAGGRAVLDGLDLEVRAGERVVLLGVNGSGKTTLLRILAGLAAPARGEVRYDGVRLEPAVLDDGPFRRRFRGEVGLLFQNVDAMLFNPTVREELAFGPRQLGLDDVDGRVARWAEAFRVDGLLARPPFELSAGEKKRVALAALLAVGPKVLLLDEPTAGLDPASAGRLVDLLAGMPELAAITATHHLSMAEELGERAVLFGQEGGRVLFDGDPHALLHDEARLVESGLAHRHVHRHRGQAHAHFHVHDGE